MKKAQETLANSTKDSTVYAVYEKRPGYEIFIGEFPTQWEAADERRWEEIHGRQNVIVRAEKIS